MVSGPALAQAVQVALGGSEFGMRRRHAAPFEINQDGKDPVEPCGMYRRPTGAEFWRERRGTTMEGRPRKRAIVLAHLGRTTNEVSVRRDVDGRLHHFWAEHFGRIEPG
jgi:hypothetical protein